MVKRFFVILFTAGVLLSASAADYFPIEVGNAWTFSYVSTSAPVVPNPLITRDSGTVKWDIFDNRNVEMINVYTVKLTHSLARRSMWPSDCTAVRIDSVFSPPRTTIDTVILRERIDQAGISFSDATCAFAVHDPTVAMPANLSAKDTTVPFVGALLPVACKKMIVSICSCLKGHYAYSFTLGPSIGPIEANINSVLPGSSFQEKWKLINREFPTAVLKATAPAAVLKTVAASQSLERVNCRLNLDHASPVRIEIIDLNGRVIRTLLKGLINAGYYRYSWSIPAHPAGVALLRVRTGTEDRCVRIMTGVK
jgi:hypothetical protein